MKYYTFILLIICLSCDDKAYYNPSDHITGIPILDVRIDADNLSILLSNRTINREVSCELEFRGRVYPARIRAAGAGARFFPKWSYNVSLDGEAKIEGLNSFNLSAQVLDKTMMKTNLSLDLYKAAGFPAFFSCHTFLRINSEDCGLYLLIEKVEKAFFEHRGLNISELYKLIFKAKLSFNSNYYPQFGTKKYIPDDNNLNGMIELIKMADTCSPDNLYTDLGAKIDIDNYLLYAAASMLLNNWDGFENNLYFYRAGYHSPFCVIPWDFDKCFDYELVTGLSVKNGLLNKIFLNDSAFAVYKEKVKYLLNTHFTEANILETVDSLYPLIEYPYSLDPQLKYYDLNYETCRLKDFIFKRRRYFIENIDAFSQEDYFGN